MQSRKAKRLEIFRVMTNDTGTLHTKYYALVAYRLLYNGYGVFPRGKAAGAWR
jgi:hypothetical protein